MIFRFFLSTYFIHEIVFLSLFDFDAVSIPIRRCYSFNIINEKLSRRKKMMPSSPRLVDRIPANEKRPREMEVLCLGLPRTGTMCSYNSSDVGFSVDRDERLTEVPNHPLFMHWLALYTALNILGYKSYHYIEVRSVGNEKHTPCWLEAMTAKVHGQGKLYERAEFDKLLGNYGVR